MPEAEASQQRNASGGHRFARPNGRLTVPQQSKIGIELAATMPTAETIAQWLPCALSVAKTKSGEQADDLAKRSARAILLTLVA